MHKCPIDSCKIDVPDHHLMCGKHWRRVPADIAARVNRLWDAFQESRDAKTLKLYRAARNEAIAAVEVGEEAKAR